MRKYKFNESSFEELNSDSAYWLGVLFADGYINWNTFSSPQTVLSLKDFDHLVKFKDFLESDFTILKQIHRSRVKLDGLHPVTYRININSSKIANDIKKYGFELELPTEELRFNRDFWRGVIDGDGSIYFSTDRNKYERINLSLVGSKNLLNCFSLFVQKHYPNTKAKVCKHKSIFDVKLASKAARVIINVLYGGNPKFFLTRKMKRAITCLNKD